MTKTIPDNSRNAPSNDVGKRGHKTRRPVPPDMGRHFGSACETHIEKDGLTDFYAAAETGALLHGKLTGGDVSHNGGIPAEVAAITAHIAVHMTVHVNFSGIDIALDVGHLTDGHLAGFGKDFTVNLAVDVHIVLETDGTDNLDTGSQNIGGGGTHI